MIARLRILALERLPRGLPWWPLLVLTASALIYGQAILIRPPWGGLIGLLLALALSSVLWIMLRRVGVFLMMFITFATIAPFLSRIVFLPLGWFKGIFFLLALPLWVLSRVSAVERGTWWRGVRSPLLLCGLSVLIVAVLCVVSILRGVDALNALDALKGYLLYPPMIFLAAEGAGDLRSERRAFRWILALSGLAAAGAVAQALLGFELMSRLGLSLETGGLAYIAIDPLSGRVFQRVFSILDDQGALAAFSLTGIALSIYLMQVERTLRRRIVYAIVLAFNAYALILTYNVTVAIGTVLFVLILIWRSRSPRLLAIFLAVVLVVWGVSWLHFGPMIRNRLVTSFSIEAGVSSSLLGRIEENLRAVCMFVQEPLIGRGLGSTASAGLYYKLGLAESIDGGIATDNFYMTTILEGGLVGLGAVLLLHLVPFWGLVRLRRSSIPSYRILGRVGGAWAFVLLLMNLSNSPMSTNPTNLVYWCLGGLAWRASFAPTEGRHLSGGARKARGFRASLS